MTETDPDKVTDSLAKAWRLRFEPYRTDVAQIGAAREESTGLEIGATLTSDAAGQLHRMECWASDSRHDSLNEIGVRFIHGCVLQAVHGSDRVVVDDWLTKTLVGDVLRIQQVPQFRTIRRDIGELRLNLMYGPGLMVEIYRPE